jgi:3-polyprenyl-4-hydroxybenzoate decarboxylase and related decarboxylases
MTADIREYISKLKKSKEIKIIKKKVSTKFEIAGITAEADGTSALLFENIKQK